jgi:hypothetical protein
MLGWVGGGVWGVTNFWDRACNPSRPLCARSSVSLCWLAFQRPTGYNGCRISRDLATCAIAQNLRLINVMKLLTGSFKPDSLPRPNQRPRQFNHFIDSCSAEEVRVVRRVESWHAFLHSRRFKLALVILRATTYNLVCTSIGMYYVIELAKLSQPVRL